MQFQFEHTVYAGCKDCPKFIPASPDNLEEGECKGPSCPLIETAIAGEIFS